MITNLRRHRDRRRPCRLRSRVGGGPARLPRRPVHAVARDRRADAVQSGDRRHREGPSRSRDRRAGRPDGPRDRRDRHPVQAAQPQPRSGGVVAARAGGQAPLRRVGARGACRPSRTSRGSSAAPAGFSRRPDASPGSRSRTAARWRAVRSSSRPARFSTGWSTSATSSGRRAAPTSRRRASSPIRCARFGFEMGRLKTGTPPRLDRRTHRLLAISRRAWRRSDRAVLVHERPDRSATRSRVTSLHTNRARARPRAREHRPIAALQRPDQRHRTAVLPVARRQGHALRRKGAASDLSRAGRRWTSTRSTSTACR